MADIMQQQHEQSHTGAGIVEVEGTVDDLHTLTVTEGGGHETATEVGVEVTEDILQQALEVAAENFGHGNVELEYREVDESGGGVQTELVTSVVDTDSVVTLVQHVETEGEVCFEQAQYVDVDEELSNSAMGDIDPNDNALQNGDLATELMAEDVDPESQVFTLQTSDSADVDPEGQVFTLQTSDSADGQGLKVTLLPANAQSGAPLGSSQNPIRIIQQGNQYTPVQQLSTDQLSQIMQVVQQQQLAKSAQDGGGSSTLFNPHTNTRIVYRVIYPSELHKAGGGINTLISTQSQGQQTFVPRRTYKKRRLEDEDEEKDDAPELSREEKEERKKHRPRTRSGRVSKPPKHMVQDYKHIHILDWDEDPYDDSDGGYSDFKYSDDESPSLKDNEDSNDFTDWGVDWGVTRPKKWKCKTCKKAYIGKGGLDRHYRLNPDHGEDTDIPKEPPNCPEEPGGRMERKSLANGLPYCEQFSEDSNTQDSFQTITTTTTATSGLTNHAHRRRPGWPRGVPRSRPQSVLEMVPHKRKAKLRELVKHCENEELMEVVLPRLKDAVSLWEFLLMKVEKGKPARPYVGDVLQEYEALHRRVQKMCQKYLEPLQNSQLENPNIHKIKIQDDNMALSLGMSVGSYTVKSVSDTEDYFHSGRLGKAERVTSVSSNVRLATTEGIISVTRATTDGVPPVTRATTVGVPSVSRATSDGVSPVSISAWQVPQVSPVPAQFVLTKDSNSPATKCVRINLPHSGMVTMTAMDASTSSGFNVVNIQSEIQAGKRLNTDSSVNVTSAIVNGTSVTLSGPPLDSIVSAPSLSGSGQSLLSTAIPTASPVKLSLPSRTASHVVYTSSGSIGALTSSHQSLITMTPSPHPTPTQITIPVVLPQGTERISLELPPHLAGSIIDGIAQGQTLSVVPSVTDNAAATQLIMNLSMGNSAAPTQLVINPSTGHSDTPTQLVMNSGEGDSSAPTQLIMDPPPICTVNSTVSTQVIVDGSAGEQSGAEIVETNIEETLAGEDGDQQEHVLNVENLGEVHLQAMEDNTSITQFVQETGEITAFENRTEIILEDQLEEGEHIVTGSNIFQTEDGIVIIQQADGTMLQLQAGQNIPLETVQALLSMDGETPIEGEMMEQ